MKWVNEAEWTVQTLVTADFVRACACVKQRPQHQQQTTSPRASTNNNLSYLMISVTS